MKMKYYLDVSMYFGEELSFCKGLGENIIAP